MRMRVRATHKRALVLLAGLQSGYHGWNRTHFKDLDVIYSVLRTPLSIYRAPFFYNALDIGDGEASERQIVSGVEDNDVASTLNGFRLQ